ncbi:MAG TPA: histidinol dehydrogenase, partial [Nitrococcus sp.]|nr:histidinol dehydrogenase [Nitrococcus sp.]
MLTIKRLSTTQPDFWANLRQLLAWDDGATAQVEQTVAEILAAVRQRGDAAVLEYTARFDRIEASCVAELEIPLESRVQALAALPAVQREALEFAAERIRTYHERQKIESWSYIEPDGSVLGQQVTPLESVGVYVPGGKAAYPSSVLMNVLPARVAGVGRITMLAPAPGGEINPLVLAAAQIACVDRLFTVGGAQAIGALAYGSETIAAVDKIVGPGNAYVAEAKRRVFGHVGIDMVAGPSEIVVVCDGQTDPEWIAMDLFAQAEHDEDARAMLVCPDPLYLDQVQSAMERLLPAMDRSDIIRVALNNR